MISIDSLCRLGRNVAMNLLEDCLSGPRRIRHEMLHRLTIATVHTPTEPILYAHPRLEVSPNDTTLRKNSGQERQAISQLPPLDETVLQLNYN